MWRKLRNFPNLLKTTSPIRSLVFLLPPDATKLQKTAAPLETNCKSLVIPNSILLTRNKGFPHLPLQIYNFLVVAHRALKDTLLDGTLICYTDCKRTSR